MNMKLLAEVLDIQPISAVIEAKVIGNSVSIKISKPNFPENGYKTAYMYLNKYELEHDYKVHMFEKFNIKVGSYIRDAWVSFPMRDVSRHYSFSTVIEACEFAYKELSNAK